MKLAAANKVMLEGLVIPTSKRGYLAHYSHQENADVAAAKYQSLIEWHSWIKTVSLIIQPRVCCRAECVEHV